MGSSAIKMDFKMVLLFVVFLFLSVELTSGGVIKTSEFVNKNYCRNHIFHPRCRGQQKRDVVSHPTEDFRVAPLETDLGLDRRDIVALINLSEFLRKAVDAQYEPENANYLK